jgi:hypothetical protein
MVGANKKEKNVKFMPAIRAMKKCYNLFRDLRVIPNAINSRNPARSKM